MKNVMDISFYQLSIAYIFILILIFIVRIRGIKREKDIILSTVRMTLQLVLAGYLLTYIFKYPSWWLTSITITIMLAFAVSNVYHRTKYELSKKLKIIIALSLIIGSMVTIGFFLLFVIQVSPWFNPQYFIPISGMVIGNSMTGILLGVNKLCGDMKDKAEMIENSLMLGATPSIATKEITDASFDYSILPTINTMIGMGIVSLPGMMTGQILSGTMPMTAIKYQIGIMLAILGAISLTVVIFVNLAYKTFFNKDSQLEL